MPQLDQLIFSSQIIFAWGYLALIFGIILCSLFFMGQLVKLRQKLARYFARLGHVYIMFNNGKKNSLIKLLKKEFGPDGAAEEGIPLSSFFKLNVLESKNSKSYSNFKKDLITHTLLLPPAFTTTTYLDHINFVITSVCVNYKYFNFNCLDRDDIKHYLNHVRGGKKKSSEQIIKTLTEIIVGVVNVDTSIMYTKPFREYEKYIQRQWFLNDHYKNVVTGKTGLGYSYFMLGSMYVKKLNDSLLHKI